MRRVFVLSLLALAACDTGPTAPTATGPTTTAPTTTSPTTTAPATAPTEAERATRAATAAKALQGQLKTALTGAIEKGGPVAAIDVCATMAPAIAKGLSVDGLTVARTSSRLRNPANLTPAWLSSTMEAWAKAPANERQPMHRVLDDGRLVFAAPLSMQPLCATCHGPAVADDVKAAIAARYPADQATGFGPDDLRGAVWVELTR